MSLFVFILCFIVFTFQGSHKYLLGKDKDEAALKALHIVARTNKQEYNITMETFAAISRDDASGSSGDSGAPILEFPGGIRAANEPILDKTKFELKRSIILFSTPTLARLTILVWVIYVFDYWGFSVAGQSLKASY
jgi:hypothetical protein